MDVPCSIQGNIHAFSLIINVSRILGTYQMPKLFLLLPLCKMFPINPAGITPVLEAWCDHDRSLLETRNTICTDKRLDRCQLLFPCLNRMNCVWKGVVFTYKMQHFTR